LPHEASKVSKIFKELPIEKSLLVNWGLVRLHDDTSSFPLIGCERRSLAVRLTSSILIVGRMLMNATSVAAFLRIQKLVFIEPAAHALLACLCIASCGLPAEAAIIANDTFAYATGIDLAGNNGGSGWAGAWSATESAATKATIIDVSGNPLSFTPAGGQPMSGGNQALEVKLDTGMSGNNRAGARQLASPLQQTFYAGYLFRYDGTDFGGSNNTFTLHLSDSASNQTSFNFGVRGNTPGSATAPPAGGPQEFVVRSGTGNPVTGAFGGGDLINGKEYFLLAKLTYSGTNYDQIDVWVDPPVNPGAPNLTLSLPAGTGLTQINHVFFRQAANQASDDIFIADRLVLGQFLSDLIVPEPTALALFAGAGTGIFGVCYRRRS
jgi:hypothetical protein